jgi:hypothetical protein
MLLISWCDGILANDNRRVDTEHLAKGISSIIEAARQRCCKKPVDIRVVQYVVAVRERLHPRGIANVAVGTVATTAPALPLATAVVDALNAIARVVQIRTVQACRVNVP